MAKSEGRDAAHFKVSSFSGGGNCVAVDLQRPDEKVAVRHSHHEQTLLFNRAEWNAFIAGVKNDEFDVR